MLFLAGLLLGFVLGGFAVVYAVAQVLGWLTRCAGRI